MPGVVAHEVNFGRGERARRPLPIDEQAPLPVGLAGGQLLECQYVHASVAVDVDDRHVRRHRQRKEPVQVVATPEADAVTAASGKTDGEKQS